MGRSKYWASVVDKKKRQIINVESMVKTESNKEQYNDKKHTL